MGESGLPRGWNLSGMFRAGTGKRYTSRPPASSKAARAFWDHMSERGPIEWIQLLDGYWGCQRPFSALEEHEAHSYTRGGN